MATEDAMAPNRGSALRNQGLIAIGARTAALPPGAGAVGAVSEHPVKTEITPPRTRKRIGCDMVHLISILWIVKDHRAAPGHARPRRDGIRPACCQAG